MTERTVERGVRHFLVSIFLSKIDSRGQSLWTSFFRRMCGVRHHGGRPPEIPIRPVDVCLRVNEL